MKKRFEIIFVIIAVGLTGLLLLIPFGLFVFNKANDVSYSQYWISTSPDDAKKNKVFVTTANIEPKEIIFDGNKVEFDEIWIEQASEIYYKYFFIKARKYYQGYRICLTIKNNDLLNNLIDKYIDMGIYDVGFKEKDHKNSFSCTGGKIYSLGLNLFEFKKGFIMLEFGRLHINSDQSHNIKNIKLSWSTGNVGEK